MQNYAKEELFFVFTPEERKLYSELLELEERLHFPAVKPQVGAFLKSLIHLHKPKIIFEFGSGYGHSAFWYLLAKTSNLSKIYLTEKRDDLEDVFHHLSWPTDWKKKLFYKQGDAFESFKDVDSKIDFLLIDGEKAKYLDFLQTINDSLNEGAIVIIDNAFWKGMFLDQEKKHKVSPQGILKLHNWLKEQTLFHVCFLPISDGLFLLQKK